MSFAFITGVWSEFPTEVLATSVTALLLILRQMDKRKGVTLVDLLRAEMRWGEMLQRNIKDLRLEFEGKLENLRKERGD